MDEPVMMPMGAFGG